MANLATWFTPSLQTFSRSAGRSAVAAAAYRACAKLTDQRTGVVHDYRPKAKTGLAENICINIENDDIEKLFNNAEQAETRVNSTVARELMVPLAADWSDVERALCARALAELINTTYSVAVLASIHKATKDNNNEHVHILFTTREVDANGVFGKKTRILDDVKTGEVKKLREAVCEIVNAHARKNKSDWFVHAGKFSDIIEDHIPTKHVSIKSRKSQKTRIDSNRKDVTDSRTELSKIKLAEKAISEQIAALSALPALPQWSQNVAPTAASATEGGMEDKRLKDALTRIELPPAAIQAKEQIEKALFSRKTLQQHFNSWASMHKELLSNPPIPEFGLFGRPKTKYKNALPEYAEKLSASKTGMAECTAKATTLVDYIKNPERQRLHNVYKATIAYNARVQEHEMQLAQQREREQVQREHEANRVDWMAYLEDTPQPTPKQDSYQEYSNGGMEM